MHMRSILLSILIVVCGHSFAQMSAADSIEFNKLVKKFVIEKDEFRETVSYRHRMFQADQMGIRVLVTDAGPWMYCSYLNQNGISPTHIEFKINGEFLRVDFTSVGNISVIMGHISESASAFITPGLVADIATEVEKGDVMCRVTGSRGIVDLKITKKHKIAWKETLDLCRLKYK